MSNGTAGTRQQTWALMNGGRSGLFDRDRSKDNLLWGEDQVASKPTTVLAPTEVPGLTAPAAVPSLSTTGALTQFANGSGQSSAFVPPGYAATDPNINPKTGQKWTADELASIVAGESASTDDSQFYEGGLGLPTWGVNAAKTGLGIVGALNGIPSPVTKVAGAILGPVLGEEGINEHTLANSAIDAGLSLNPITGLLNMGGKAIAGLMGKKYDLANAIGEATGTYPLRSPDSLNLELFNNNSDSAYDGFNQRTAAEIARQEALNAQEHVQRQQNEYLAQHDIDTEQRAVAQRAEEARQAAARQEALQQEALQQEAARQEMARQEALQQEAARQETARVSALAQYQAQQEANAKAQQAVTASITPVSQPVQQAITAQTSNRGSPLAAFQALTNSGAFDSGSAYGITGYGPTSSGTSGNAGTQSSSYGYSNPASSYGGW